MMLKAEMIKSKGEGRRLIDQGGVSVNEQKISSPLTTLKLSDFDKDVIIKKGKKVFHKFTK